MHAKGRVPLARGFARQCSSKTLAPKSCRQWHPALRFMELTGLIEQEFHESGITRNRRSRSAANAKHARMSS